VVVLAFRPADRALRLAAGRQHDYYTTRAEDNRISLVPIAPNRGVIVDRNGGPGAQLLGLHARDHAVQGRES
jgi:cell division protein FtsI/penicillin-binding protein 2